MLLQLTDIEIKDDIGIKNGILRKRFIRELKELKKTADYTSCDGGLTANSLLRVGPEYRGYTYSLIQGELSLDLMQRLSAADLEDMLKDCGVESAIHRHKIIDAAINGTDDESFADRCLDFCGIFVFNFSVHCASCMQSTEFLSKIVFLFFSTFSRNYFTACTPSPAGTCTWPT